MKTFKIATATGVALLVLMMGGSVMAYSETFTGFPVRVRDTRDSFRKTRCIVHFKT